MGDSFESTGYLPDDVVVPRATCCYQHEAYAAELGSNLDEAPTDIGESSSTAEIAANAPISSKEFDFHCGIHDVAQDQTHGASSAVQHHVGSAVPLGRIAIVMVGLPARGRRKFTWE